MILNFYKYQGTGNDFVVIDNRNNVFDSNNIDLIKFLCDRKFGIGSDGLILIENHSELDFNMIFFNPDGSQSFCGNGSRCAVAFAKKLGIIKESTKFNSTDGYHEAHINDKDEVGLKMHNVVNVEIGDDYHYMNTGSPHFNKFVEDVSKIDVVEKGREIRNNDRFIKEGTNVNFIEEKKESLAIRTYERGVENETLSCGTGVTACVLSHAIKENINSGEINVSTKGGQLMVSFCKEGNDFKNIWLNGPTSLVFIGEIEV